MGDKCQRKNTHPFYPRSPHGERRRAWNYGKHTNSFLSTLSAWRATVNNHDITVAEYELSIHALRMESDGFWFL